MTQMPAKPNRNPFNAAMGMRSFEVKRPMITIHNGNVAAMMAPSPAEIYFTPHVVSPLLQRMLSTLSTPITYHSRPLGHVARVTMK